MWYPERGSSPEGRLMSGDSGATRQLQDHVQVPGANPSGVTLLGAANSPAPPPLLLPLAAAAAAAAAEAAEPKAPNSASKVYLFLVGCELRKKVGLFESCRSRFEKKNIQTVEMCDKSIS